MNEIAINNFISKNENISDYPQIATIFNNTEVISFERPSYFSNKRNLQTIFRVVFSDFDKIDSIISQLELLSVCACRNCLSNL